MPSDQKTTIPAVPLRSEMFDADGRMNRTWVIFFEGLGRSPAQRTLLVKDTAVGNDIADHVTAYRGGKPQLFTGVLRKAITTDLSVRMNVNNAPFVTLVIPKTTAINKVLTTSGAAFAATIPTFNVQDVFTWDILTSDGTTDKNGIASFTIYWRTAAGH